MENSLPQYDALIWVGGHTRLASPINCIDGVKEHTNIDDAVKWVKHDDGGRVLGTVAQCTKMLNTVPLWSDEAIVMRDLIVNATVAAEVRFIEGAGADIFWARTAIEGLRTLYAMRTGQADIMAGIQRDQLRLLRQRLAEYIDGDPWQPNAYSVTECIDDISEALGNAWRG